MLKVFWYETVIVIMMNSKEVNNPNMNRVFAFPKLNNRLISIKPIL